MGEIVQPLFISVKTVTLLHEKYGCRALTFFIFIWNFLLAECTEALYEKRSPAGHHKTAAHQAGLG